MSFKIISNLKRININVFIIFKSVWMRVVGNELEAYFGITDLNSIDNGDSVWAQLSWDYEIHVDSLLDGKGNKVR